MGHLIAGNKLGTNANVYTTYDDGLSISNIKGDTIVASKTWVKENLDKVKEWATEKE